MKRASDTDNGMIQGGAVLTFTFLLVALVPYVGPFVLILTPMPILYYRFRLGRQRSWIVLACSLLSAYVILKLAEQRASLAAFLMIGLTGLLLAEVLKRNFSIEKTVLVTSSGLFTCTALFILYHALQAGLTPWQMVEAYVSGMIAENLKLYAQMNIQAEQLQMIRENAPQLAQFFTGIFPALSLSGIVITVWINLIAARRLFDRAGIAFPDFGDLAAWKAPEPLVWVLIASGAMLLLPLEGPSLVGTNLLILCMLVYLFQGLAIAVFFFRQKRVPRMVRLLFYGLILVQQYMLVVLIAFGLFDMWVDFRKRIAGIRDNPENQ